MGVYVIDVSGCDVSVDVDDMWLCVCMGTVCLYCVGVEGVCVCGCSACACCVCVDVLFVCSRMGCIDVA